MPYDRIVFSRYVPRAIRAAFVGAGQPSSPEQELEREIASIAVMDACGDTGESNRAEHNAVVLEARRWFLYGDAVEDVFINAGVECNRVRTLILIKHAAEIKMTNKFVPGNLTQEQRDMLQRRLDAARRAFEQLPEVEQREMKAAQRRSWAIGELMLAFPKMTRQEAELRVDTALDTLSLTNQEWLKGMNTK